MLNPIETIENARRRIARVTGLRLILTVVAPALTALILAGILGWLSTLAVHNWGYSLAPSHLAAARIALIVFAALALVAGLISAWRAQRSSASDFLAAARAVDTATGASLEVLTLAEIANPAHTEAQRMAARTPLFPMLWRRAIAYLESFNPTRAFPLNPGGPLRRSSLLSLAVVILLGLAMLALVKPPTPQMREALKLRRLGAELAGTPSGNAMAAKVRSAAAALLNPNLSPKRKLEVLAAVHHDLQQMKKPKPQGSAHGKQTTGGSSGKGSASAAGNGSGKDRGAGKGSGGGKGTGSGSGPGTGTAKNNNSKNPAKGGKDHGKQVAEIEKTLDKAAAQIEEQGAAKNLPAPSPSKQSNKGNAPKPEQNPNLPGQGNKRSANASASQPTPAQTGANTQARQGQNNPSQKSSKYGDTPMGVIPKSVKYQHFYKPGEKGPPLSIKDARFVVFRIPAAKSTGGGRTVLDTNAPRATTPYANTPLAAGELNTTPDEHQFVPPRYRDLIR